ncbi:E3 ubiquitin-protein ligase MARCHF3 [Clupea harengus]|uniref:RING-type E3 ubiquitin transferase n=1 Tax=Clupea harengus TaxID=7950 RepID=A0A6P8FQ51_CLUHA|nr:E3 ubiquitin-protein ligase MARCHF3 [Clupea harengus]XP_031425570.1 E3 ubiquitin-protein ligase MARCHF3 [Clupea harengus]
MAPYVAAMACEEVTSVLAASSVTLLKAQLEPAGDQTPVPDGEEAEDCKGHEPSNLSSSSTNTLCGDEPFCRICHEGGSVEELLSPCECSGSLAMVHRGCLEHWLTASNTSRCELCHFQFALERLPKPLTEWFATPSMQHQRRTLCGDAICFLFITPLASLSGWLCVQGAMDLYYSNGFEAMGLIALTLALFTIYLFWTVVSLRYHIHLFKTWKETNQRVRLQIPTPPRTQAKQQALSFFLSKDTTKETVV